MNIFPSSISDIGGFWNLADHERKVKQLSEPMSDLEKALAIFDMFLTPLSFGQNIVWKDIAWEVVKSSVDYNAIITAFTSKRHTKGSLILIHPSGLSEKEIINLI